MAKLFAVLIVLKTIDYENSQEANEEITDMVFSQGSYQTPASYPILDEEECSDWRNAVASVNRLDILKALYEDNKISYAYLIKHFSNPLSLYELSSYQTLQALGNNCAEKIDTLELPIFIKEDLKKALSE
jgi:hypothetical protein